jgi:hypothetical protein
MSKFEYKPRGYKDIFEKEKNRRIDKVRRWKKDHEDYSRQKQVQEQMSIEVPTGPQTGNGRLYHPRKLRRQESEEIETDLEYYVSRTFRKPARSKAGRREKSFETAPHRTPRIENDLDLAAYLMSKTNPKPPKFKSRLAMTQPRYHVTRRTPTVKEWTRQLPSRIPRRIVNEGQDYDREYYARPPKKVRRQDSPPDYWITPRYICVLFYRG